MVYILVVVTVVLLIVLMRFILAKKKHWLGEFIIDSNCDTSTLKPCDANEVDTICAERFHTDLLLRNIKAVNYNNEIERLVTRYSLLIMEKISQYAREHGYICGKFYIRTHELLSLPAHEVKPKVDGLDKPSETLTTVRLARDICTELDKHKYKAYIKSEKDCVIKVSWSTSVPSILKEKYTAPDTYIV